MLGIQEREAVRVCGRRQKGATQIATLPCQNYCTVYVAVACGLVA